MAPFNRRSTALDVVEGIDLSGKTAVVTGGNRFVFCRKTTQASDAVRHCLCCLALVLTSGMVA